MVYAISTFNLQIIDNLFEQKKSEFKDILNNLQIGDVKEDSRYEATVARLKRDILLKTVTFEEPKIQPGHYTETINVGPNYMDPFEGSKNVTVVTVNFPFTGSEELFEYTPANVSFTSGAVYQPTGNVVPVELKLDKLDKENALAEAKERMQSTFQIIKANSEQAEKWSKENEPVIEAELEKKRQELLDFYD